MSIPVITPVRLGPPFPAPHPQRLRWGLTATTIQWSARDLRCRVEANSANLAQVSTPECRFAPLSFGSSCGPGFDVAGPPRGWFSLLEIRARLVRPPEELPSECHGFAGPRSRAWRGALARSRGATPPDANKLPGAIAGPLLAVAKTWNRRSV